MMINPYCSAFDNNVSFAERRFRYLKKESDKKSKATFAKLRRKRKSKRA